MSGKKDKVRISDQNVSFVVFNSNVDTTRMDGYLLVDRDEDARELADRISSSTMDAMSVSKGLLASRSDPIKRVREINPLESSVGGSFHTHINIPEGDYATANFDLTTVLTSAIGTKMLFRMYQQRPDMLKHCKDLKRLYIHRLGLMHARSAMMVLPALAVYYLLNKTPEGSTQTHVELLLPVRNVKVASRETNTVYPTNVCLHTMTHVLNHGDIGLCLFFLVATALAFWLVQAGFVWKEKKWVKKVHEHIKHVKELAATDLHPHNILTRKQYNHESKLKKDESTQKIDLHDTILQNSWTSFIPREQQTHTKIRDMWNDVQNHANIKSIPVDPSLQARLSALPNIHLDQPFRAQFKYILFATTVTLVSLKMIHNDVFSNLLKKYNVIPSLPYTTENPFSLSNILPEMGNFATCLLGSAFLHHRFGKYFKKAFPEASHIVNAPKKYILGQASAIYQFCEHYSLKVKKIDYTEEYIMKTGIPPPSGYSLFDSSDEQYADIYTDNTFLGGVRKFLFRSLLMNNISEQQVHERIHPQFSESNAPKEGTKNNTFIYHGLFFNDVYNRLYGKKEDELVSKNLPKDKENTHN